MSRLAKHPFRVQGVPRKKKIFGAAQRRRAREEWGGVKINASYTNNLHPSRLFGN